MFEVNEKNKGIKKDRETFQIQYSEEILIQKVERDKFQADIEHLNTGIQQARINNQITVDKETKRKMGKKEQLEKEMEYKEIENRTRYDALLDSKKEMERTNEDKIASMLQQHEIELERRRQDYEDKMKADELRFQELLTSKEEEAR